MLCMLSKKNLMCDDYYNVIPFSFAFYCYFTLINFSMRNSLSQNHFKLYLFTPKFSVNFT